jgi:uncharacterized protein DUF6328
MSEDEDTDRSGDKQRDRQMIELLNELRVALPGVQILFGFLLTVPFSNGFQKATGFQKNLLLATLMLVALSTVCFIAPSAAHRVLFHQRQRPWLVEHANRMAIAGLVFLALSLVAAVLLVTQFLFTGSASVVIIPVLLAVVIVTVWFGRPLVRRRDVEVGP